MDREKFDLIIVGGGPAGLSTALHLIRQDPTWVDRMVILEKAVHPRPKLCGGGLTRFGLRILRELGFVLPLPIPHATVNQAYIIFRKRRIHVRGEPLFQVFDRAVFDHHLLEQARQRGISILEGQAVNTLQVTPLGIRVITSAKSYLAQVVVGADGSLGMVRKLLLRERGPKRVARTLDIIMPAPAISPRFAENSALFDFTYVGDHLGGYFWDFPVLLGGQPAHNRGIYDSRLAPGDSRADLPGLLKRGLQAFEGLPSSAQIKGHPIHWFHPGGQISTDRVLLVGDAAGAEVLFGEGIAPALGYGKIAAGEIHEAFQAQDFSFRHYRTHVLFSPLGKYFLPRWIGANYVYRLGKQPLFMHLLWTFCQYLAAIWRAGPPDQEHG